jgi:hypothetical protein
MIKDNVIKKNYKHGVTVWSFSSFGGENIRCDGEICNNLIECNLGYGIRTKGKNCVPRIFNGNRICYNKKAGIKIDHDSHPCIINNEIFKNMH